MKIDIIGVTNVPNNEGVIQLKKSLVKYKLRNNIIVTPWEGFFTKVDQAYKYCQTTKADYILFVDAHDVIFRGGIDVIIEKIKELGSPDALFSAEKAIWPDKSVWPDPSLANNYPEVDSPWKYLNSGTFLIKPKLLVEFVSSNIPSVGVDDQFYWTQHYLNNLGKIDLDTNCDIFQTLAHDSGESFELIGRRFTNLVTGTNPIIIHGNGKAFDEFDYSYIYP